MLSYSFLIPLVCGFIFNLGSAFTSLFTHRLGNQSGSLVSAIFRNVLGIPVWTVGFILAIRTSSPVLFQPTIVTRLAGWLLIVVGGGIILIALVTLRFRAVKPSVQDSLAQHGIYAYMRHPIHVGTLLEFVGLVLVYPVLSVGLAGGLGVIWVILQTYCEEIDLVQRMPGYRDYMKTVPRFIPRLWVKKAS
jgi:protein-S-isoprenylcysteine O-methyltransferase Ste14